MLRYKGAPTRATIEVYRFLAFFFLDDGAPTRATIEVYRFLAKLFSG